MENITMKKTSKVILIIIATISFLYLSCNNNPFFGVGVTPDTQPPIITITNHSNNDIVSGTLTLNGTIGDDIKIAKAELFVVSSSATGQVETKLADCTINNETWTVQYDTTQFNMDKDESKLFKVVATDTSNKIDSRTINLFIDNFGPYISITEPTNKSSDIYFNIFRVSLVCIDASPIKELKWQLVSENDNTAIITGDITTDTSISSSYSFYLDPTPLAGKGSSKFMTGNCTLKIRGVDSIGNGTSTKWYTKTIYMDFANDKPKVTISNPEETTEISAKVYGSDFNITGTAEDDDGVKSIVVWYKKTTNADPTIDTIDGESSFIKPFSHSLSGLTDGTYQVKIYATDIHDVTCDYTEFHYFKVNTNYPVITFSYPTAGNWERGTINVLANIVSPSGTIKKVEVKTESSSNSTSWSTVYEDATGVSPYSFNQSLDTISAVPNGGQMTYFIRATDNTGFYTDQYIIFNVDNVIPSGSIDSPILNNSGLNQTVKIQGTASDQIGGGTIGVVDSVSIDIDGFGVVSPTGISNWSYNYDTSSIQNGDVTVDVSISDLAGNELVLTRILHIDQSADIPLISVTTPTPNERIYGMYVITGIASDDDAIKNVKIQIDSDASIDVTGTTSWSYKFDTSSYSNGNHTLSYIAYDINDKPSEIGSVNFRIDPDLPAIQYNAPYNVDNVAISGNSIITGYVTKNNPGVVSSIEVKLQGTKRSDGTSYTIDWTTTGLTVNNLNTTNASFSYTISSSTWDDGPITISIRAKDDLARVNSSSRNLIIDTQAPSAALTQPLSNSTQTDFSIDLAGNCSDSTPSSGLSSNDILLDFFYVSTSTNYHIIDGSAPEVINGSVSNWTYSMNADSTYPDGLYTVTLSATDRAGNQSTDQATNVRLMRYTPTFSNLYINSEPVSDNMFIVKDCQFTGHISDNNINDSVSGVEKIEIYLSSDSVIDAGDSLLTSNTWGTIENEKDFTLNCSFTESKNYIIYRAIDRVGGNTDYPVLVNIDFTPPNENFKYSSRDYYPSYQTSNPGYSASYWVKLDAQDDNSLNGASVQIKLGTTNGGEEILGLTTKQIGDWLECDLHDISQSTIYLWYKLSDKAGNETIGTLSLSRDTSLPSITSTSLSNGFFNSSGLTVTGTASAGSGGPIVTSVKFSDVDGNLDSTNDVDSGTTSWTYTIPAPSTGDHTIIGLVTADDGTNWYQKFDFTYDNVAPNCLIDVKQISGGRVVGNNLSGTVRFYGTFTDNYDDRYAASDIILTLTIDGVDTTIPDLNKTKNADGSFDWYYDWNSETGLSSIVKNSVAISITAEDKAGNSKQSTLTAKNIVPYITDISLIVGKVAPVNMYSGSIWENINDNQNYIYRLSSGNITLNGYNLNASGSESLIYTKDSGGNYSGFSFTQDMHSISFDLTWNATSLTNGNLKIDVGGINSNTKNFYIIKNYSNNTFVDMGEMDMVVNPSDNTARVVYQKHIQGYGSSQNTGRTTVPSGWWMNLNGSALYKFKETSEGLFSPSSHSDGDFLTKGFNRFWFISLDHDSNASESDGGFYLFTDDSENVASNSKGLQLTGSSDFWNTLPTEYASASGDDAIWLPTNDYANPGSDGDAQYRNRWRMTAPNADSSDNLNDWSVSWGDIVADSDKIYSVWYSGYDNEMHYRMLNNSSSNSLKYPTGGDVTFSTIKGNYPSIALDSSGNPVIVCFDEDSNNLVLYKTTNNYSSIVDESSFIKVIISSADAIGAYPDVKVDSSNRVHVVYQDITNSELKYFCEPMANLTAGTTTESTIESIVVDTDSAPGYYNELQLAPDGSPVITYIAYGYLGTGNAIRTARYTGSGTTETDYETQTNWENFSLLSARNITENKVRGFVRGTGKGWIFGFGKSDRAEFFREKP